MADSRVGGLEAGMFFSFFRHCRFSMVPFCFARHKEKKKSGALAKFQAQLVGQSAACGLSCVHCIGAEEESDALPRSQKY